MKSLEHWTPFVPSIARRYRVLRFDVRGAGKSAAPPGFELRVGPAQRIDLKINTA